MKYVIRIKVKERLLGMLSVGLLLGSSGNLFLHESDHAQQIASAVMSRAERLVDIDEWKFYPEYDHKDATDTDMLATSTKEVIVPIFIYHSVRPYITGESAYQDVYDVTPELLEEELIYLRDHGYHTVHFQDVIDAFDTGKPLPPKPVIMSFDDGWRNQYLYAYPLLKRYGMSGTFFIFTNPISKKPHWMSWDEVIEMEQAGMEIGGHSRTHPILSKITTDLALDNEIKDSKEIIEQHLGHKIYAFAYPFGIYDPKVVEAVQRAGYRVARTTYQGREQPIEKRYELHGYLSSDKLSTFVAQLGE